MILRYDGKSSISNDTIHDYGLMWKRSAICTCQAAIIILAANNLAISKHDLHDQVEADADRIENTLKTLEQRLGEFGDESVRMMFSVCSDLSSRAALAVNRFRETSASRSFWEEEVDL